ncbi:unnamed protein product [Fusarium venenatum]|uniref:Uncharacterized protein n=1 Tax=Fusarium venenatum TaxID=56646 RepID=A0A2L2T4J7_9HYPO|nr:uncharacterized protein FVRRES_11459 [Fusarium venenatum]CEI38768.1 unnamed protein product [Fusarium venenatum]
MYGLESSTKVTDPFTSIECDKEKQPALGTATETVRTLRADVSRENVIISKPPLFQQERNTHTQAVREIAEAVLARLELPPQAKSDYESTFSSHWWQALENIDAYARPYADMLAWAHYYPSLSYNNFVMGGLKHPDKLAPSTNIFLNGEQQTVSVMGGAIEKITIQDDLASKL